MISIVVPCYNAEGTLDNTIKSLKAQSASDFQIVVVDDGSTDSSPKICDSFAAGDPRIRAVHQQNKGLMGAWKRGVAECDGEYIAFCDADDTYDADFIEKLSETTEKYSVDMILFGMILEYSNGSRKVSCNRLPEGYYDKDRINNEILPNLFSDGSMQSEIMIKSRCSKVFRKETLMKILASLSERVSLGEDELTTFAVVQNSDAIYCMGDYCPYHYVRSVGSMIGAFDRSVFDKIDILYREMSLLADKYGYPYDQQIMLDRLSSTLVYVKKYICRSTDGYRKTIGTIRYLRETEAVIKCVEACPVSGYAFGSKVFALLFIKRMYYPLYLLARTFERIRGRDV